MESFTDPSTESVSNGDMVELKCPKCKAKLEIDDYRKNGEDRTAVFCSESKCSYHEKPLIGLDRGEGSVFISEAFL